MSRQRAGKTLVEVLVIMAGTSVVLTTAGQLLHRVSRAERTVRDSAAAGRAETRFARVFREDVRAASAAEVADESRTLRLVSEEARIEYAASEGLVKRSGARDESRGRDGYRLGDVVITFAVEGRLAIATVEPPPAPARRATPAGRFQIVAEIGADRGGGSAESGLPVEAPVPGEER